MTKPFFRHPGGKRRLLPQYRPYIPDAFDRYLSPFVGGGALFFDLEPEAAILGDSCRPLIAAYLAVQDFLPELVGALEATPATGESFLHAREVASRQDWSFSDPFEVVDQARAFLVIKRMGFNGLWRVNRKGGCNVAVDKGKLGTDLVRLDRLILAREALRGAELHPVDFGTVLARARRGDFVFSDSPYAPRELPRTGGLFGHAELKACFTAYTAERFGDADQLRLVKELADARDRGAWVLASNSWEAGLVRLYQSHGFEAVPIQAPRSINSDGAGRAAIQEVLFVGRPFGWAAEAAAPQPMPVPHQSQHALVAA